jgi:predicted DNA-binding transcriptional regulator YafY
MRHEKAAQLLGLARRLASSAEGLTLDEMAEAVGIGRRTVERMRDAIWDLFPQMEELPDGAAKRFRISGGLDGLFQTPTKEELLELSKAASALQASGAGPRARTLEALERKIRAAMRSASLARIVPDLEALVQSETIAVQAGPRPFEDEALIAVVRQALMAMKALRFTYHGGSRPGARREVTPYGLMFGRANYLVAAESDGAEPRNWRLGRIRDIEVLDRIAARPPGFDLHGYANRSFGIYQDDVEDVVLRILPASAEEALNWQFHPTQRVAARSDGSVTVTFRASGMRELAWHLFTWRDQVEILAPVRLRELMLEELELLLSRHAISAPTAAADAGQQRGDLEDQLPR